MMIIPLVAALIWLLYKKYKHLQQERVRFKAFLDHKYRYKA
jgi:hypothetical protein